MSEKQDITKKKLTDLLVVELKTELEKRSLDKSGVKSALIKRLKKALEEDGHNPDEFIFETEIKKCKEEQVEKEDDSLIEGEEAENDATNEDGIQLSVEDEEERLMNENEGADTSSVHEQPNEEKSIKDEEEEEKEDLEDHISNKDEAEEEIDAEVSQDKELEEKEKESAVEDEDKEKPTEKTSNGVKQELDDGKEDQKKKEGTKSPVKKTVATKTKVTRDEKGKKPTSGKYLWVTGLASGTKAADLKAAFSKHGKVVDAKIVTSTRSSSSKCYGFITMSTSEEATKAIYHLNKTKLNGFNCVMTVERASNEPKNIRKISRTEKNAESNKTPTKPVAKAESVVKSAEKSTSPKKETPRDDDEIKIEDTEGEELLKDNEDEKDEKEEKVEKAGSKKSTSRPPKTAQKRPVTNFRQRSGFVARGTRGRRGFGGRNYAGSGYRRPVYETYPPANRDMNYGRRDDVYERRMREEERIRSIEYRQRLIERKQREETERLERERERLRIEKERLIRQKAELLQAEKEKQRLEREVLEREKEELRRREHLKSTSLKRPYPKENTWESRKKPALSSRYEASSSYAEGSSNMRYGNAYESNRERYAGKTDSHSSAAAGYGSSRDKREVHDHHHSSSRSTRTKISGGRTEDWKDRRLTSDSRYGSTMGAGSSSNWSDSRWPESRTGKSNSDWNKYPSSSTRSPMAAPLYSGSLSSMVPSDYGSSYDRSTYRRY